MLTLWTEISQEIYAEKNFDIELSILEYYSIKGPS